MSWHTGKGGASQLTDLSDVNTATPTNRFVLVADGVDFESRLLVEADISDLQSYLTDVVSDTTPQLGGSLDVNGNSIISVANGNIAITPDGTGDVILDGLKWPQADGTADYVLKTDGAGQLSWTAQSGGAPAGAQYLTLATDATLTSERVLTAGTNISLVDAGAGSTATLDITDVLQVTETTTPATPTTNDWKLYFKTDGLYFLDDAGSETGPLGTGGGSSLPVTDTTAVVKGSADATKLLRFEVDGFTTGTTRVITPPNADTTLAGLSVAQTFTAAQTFSGAVNVTTVNGIDVNPGSDTAADLITVGVTGTPILSWDETNDLFKFSKPVYIQSDVLIKKVGTDSLVIGQSTGSSLAGLQTLAVGIRAGENATTAGNSLFFGVNAGRSVTTSGDNVFLGTNAGSGAIGTTVSNSVAIGTNSLLNVTTGARNVFVGESAGRNVTTGGFNVGIGRDAFSGRTTGIRGVAVGYNAGKSSNSSFSIFIGYNTAASESNDYRLHIDYDGGATPLIWGDLSNKLLKFHTVDAGTSTIVDTLSLVHLSSGTPVTGFGSALRLGLQSSTTADQNAAKLKAKWSVATHATRQAQSDWAVYDYSAERTVISIGANGSAGLLGFHAATPVAKQTITGSRAGNAALADLLTKLATLGLITDSTTV